MNKNGRLVIYGSYGYTGHLISELASGLDMDVILSGRNPDKLKKQAEELKLPFKSVDLNNPAHLDELLTDADVVIHCAGPFIHTWKPVAEACLRNHCHYTDITGEIPVFETLKSWDEKFKEKGLMAMPGIGFDVVPTDCLALYLKELLPDATHLELAFQGLGGGVSRGTAKTMIENLGEGGAIRERGEIIRVPAAYKTRDVEFTSDSKPHQVVSIPWGDVSTAHFSTGIENIIVYTAMPPAVIQKMKWLRWFKPLFYIPGVKRFLKKKIDSRPPGPTRKQRETGRSQIWGEARNSQGQKVEAMLETKEGYQLTAEASLKIAQRICRGELSIGYQTPAAVYGADFILEIEGTSREKRSQVV